MPDGRDPHTVSVLASIGEVDRAAWDGCAGDDDPFVGHGFLGALEESGSVAAATGWMPRHLVARNADGRVVGCAPLYLKSHSYGEYVFDWSWAEAYERAGGRYYPKLQAAVPFTPIAGRRLLTAADAPSGTADLLARAMVRLSERLQVSSVHVTFPTVDEWRRLGRDGWLLRAGHQFHWQNRGYRSFEDFLADLSSRKRKAIRKERAAVADQGVSLRTVTGGEIEEHHWDAFFRFYRDTHGRKWGQAYLTRAFFSLLGQGMADRVMLVVAETADRRPVAGALNLIGRDTLYGRYWGCDAPFRFLHFEACYYQAIEFAIGRGLARVEAGAQGEHKIQRGYLPQPTYSAHWIADPGFRRAVDRFLASERRAADAEMRLLADASPFRERR
ncbi:MAG: GNAT family N-acetyltransferase [Rhodospirillales bacterium]